MRQVQDDLAEDTLLAAYIITYQCLSAIGCISAYSESLVYENLVEPRICPLGSRAILIHGRHRHYMVTTFTELSCIGVQGIIAYSQCPP
jgi:hypothetical protein